ncbi:MULTISPECIES: Nif3-like dinuclear metal center hexameric protein [unclassified Fusibacter]|uniref:Nif3-like dinuclear metal center hexameric protein n=1 Tax=unclassified Fusibacter TaxID=2624464 RepID=UPI0010137E38|nr:MULTISPECIES: Nif3-like dinuclear metal center hexameric protein [unclassified Fusibacter]MCK8058122.1 Nif3-like dinuclear metal center hexameric protein [Fusibacter sp. A2]NPE20704.1 Nif3-like dinuclear metal center hexameric protein [Fusibacter sp. A1]RXV62909.1 Nif3-like dinuclear metal center hexameric protein [Fusibacter sp. A1]
MRVNSKKIIQKLEQQFPKSLADSWDNVGFQIGNEDSAVDVILTCLEVTDAVIDEAVEKCAGLIIAHHPLIFKAPKTLSEHDPKAHLMTRLIKENIGLYVMHTNFDHGTGGLSDLMASELKLSRTVHLKEVHSEKLVKIIVYIPTDHVDAVETAVFEAGAGHIGKYSNCGFKSSGLGSYQATEGANPFIGEIGKLAVTEEVKLETIVQAANLSHVIEAMIKAHPYEEVAYDLIPLMNKGMTESLGRVGYLDEPMSPTEFAQHVKNCYGLETLKMSVPRDKKIYKVAVISGAGMDFIADVAHTRADAFVTGDVRYHETMESRHFGIAIADVGHFESEVVFSKGVKAILDRMIDEQGYDLRVEASSAEKPIFEFY